MNIRISRILFFLMCFVQTGYAAELFPVPSDSAIGEKRSGIVRLFSRTLSRTPRDKEVEKLAAEQERDYFNQFTGRTIGEIYIIRENVFGDTTNRWHEKRANDVHRITQEKTVRRDLFIHPGDTVNPLMVLTNRQLLRSRSYIEGADIRIVPMTPDSSVVDLVVITRDRWTIGVDLNSESNGNTFFELYDDNILGWGSKLSVKSYFNIKNWNYGGNLVAYESPNLFGSFISGRLIAGKGFDHSDFGAEIRKPFIRPTDYTLGGYGYYHKEPVYIHPTDTTVPSAYDKWGLWGGKSFYLKGVRSSLFFTGHYASLHHQTRPEVHETLNPYFHNENLLLFNVGLYREQFRTSSLIYGYGVEEDIAYGYLFSLYGGPSWSEFGNRWYLGGNFSAGHFTSIGYLRWSIALGSYLNNQDGRFYRSALTSNLNWFSNLLGKGRYKVRQFIDVNFTRGWNRLEGYHEYVGFENDAELRGLRNDFYGTNRLTIKSETVLFTPWTLLQFRFALYGFVDMGLLGNKVNLFENKFFSTVGVGVRIKNEKLIFRTINIRLGIAVGRNGWLANEYFHVNTEDKRQPLRFIPQKTSVIDLGDSFNTPNAWE